MGTRIRCTEYPVGELLWEPRRSTAAGAVSERLRRPGHPAGTNEIVGETLADETLKAAFIGVGGHPGLLASRFR